MENVNILKKSIEKVAKKQEHYCPWVNVSLIESGQQEPLNIYVPGKSRRTINKKLFDEKMELVISNTDLKRVPKNDKYLVFRKHIVHPNSIEQKTL